MHALLPYIYTLACSSHSEDMGTLLSINGIIHTRPALTEGVGQRPGLPITTGLDSSQTCHQLQVG